MATDPYEEFRNVVPKIVADEAKLDQWINGGENETVQTDGGPVPTWANIIAQLNASIGGDMTTLPATSEGAEETRTLGNWMGKVEKTYNTLDQLLADDKIKTGSIVQIIGRDSLFDGGGNVYEFVSPGTGVPDGGSFIDHTLSGGQIRGVFPNGLNVKQFGAKGNDTHDDYPAIQACLAYAGALSDITYGGVDVYAPFGTYRMSQVAICQAGITGVPSSGTPGIRLHGDGPHLTYFVADPSNTTGCIRMTSDKNSELWTAEGFSVLSDLDYDAATNSGIGLQIESTLEHGDSGFGEHPRRNARVKSVYAGGYGAGVVERSERGNFQKGIEVRNKWWPFFEDVFVRGGPRPYDPVTNDPTYTLTGRDYGIHTVGCYSPEMKDIQVLGFYLNGCIIEGKQTVVSQADIEDFRLFNVFLVGQDRGFGAIHADDQEMQNLYEPGGAIVGLHVNSHSKGVHIKYHRQISINGLYAYLPRGRGAPNFTGNPACVFVEGGSEVIINGPQFLEPGFYTDDDNASCAIRTEGVARVKVNGPIFDHGGIGVRTEPGGSGYVSVENATVGGSITSTVSPTFVPFVDNAEILKWSASNNFPGMNYVESLLESNYAGGGTSVRSTMVANRSDFAANPAPQLAEHRVVGSNSSGDTTLASSFRTDWDDNTSGSEASKITVFHKRGGSNVVGYTLEASGKMNCPSGFQSGSQIGVSGTFTAQSGETITVTNGLITGIS